MLALTPHYVFKRNVLAYLGYVGWLVALLFKFREECFLWFILMEFQEKRPQ